MTLLTDHACLAGHTATVLPVDYVKQRTKYDETQSNKSSSGRRATSNSSNSTSHSLDVVDFDKSLVVVGLEQLKS